MNISGLTLKQLRVFSAVARAGSLSRAAAGLFLSKAAVSAALAEMERHLGSPLFDRTGGRLRLNGCGEEAVGLADDILARMDGFEARARGELWGGRLRIGASVTVGNALLPGILSRFLCDPRVPAPQLAIANTAVLAQALVRFDLDAALVEGTVHTPGVEIRPWRRDRMVAIAAPDDPLAAGPPADAAALGGRGWILREPDSGTREQFGRFLEPVLADWLLVLELPTNEAIVAAVAAGLGLGFLSELAVADALALRRVAEIPLAFATERSLDVALPRGRWRSPLLDHFLACCEGAAGRPPPRKGF